MHDVRQTSCTSYFSFFPSFFLSHFPFRQSVYLETKFPIPFHTHQGIATFFIPSRSGNVHFSPCALMQRRRGRRRFIALLTFSTIRFSPATGWPWSKWNLTFFDGVHEWCALRRTSPPSFSFPFYSHQIATPRRLMSIRDTLKIDLRLILWVLINIPRILKGSARSVLGWLRVRLWWMNSE